MYSLYRLIHCYICGHLKVTLIAGRDPNMKHIHSINIRGECLIEGGEVSERHESDQEDISRVLYLLTFHFHPWWPTRLAAPHRGWVGGDNAGDALVHRHPHVCLSPWCQQQSNSARPQARQYLSPLLIWQVTQTLRLSENEDSIWSKSCL
jgi:hypothetical protein